MTILSSYGYLAVQWADQFVGAARTLNPAFLVAFSAPCLLSVLCRSMIAFLSSILFLSMALVTVRFLPGQPYQWGVALGMNLAGILGITQTVLLRRMRRQLRRAELSLGELRQEFGEIRDKYEAEIFWRKACERVTAKKQGAPRNGADAIGQAVVPSRNSPA